MDSRKMTFCATAILAAVALASHGHAQTAGYTSGGAIHPGDGYYNFAPAQLPRLSGAIGAIRAKTSVIAHVMLNGDSTTWGEGTGPFSLNPSIAGVLGVNLYSHPTALATILNAGILPGAHQDCFFGANGVTNNNSNVTITNASPAVISWTSHGLPDLTPVTFDTTGALPTGFAVKTAYFIVPGSQTTNTFELSATPGGLAINTSSAGSGTHSAWPNSDTRAQPPVGSGWSNSTSNAYNSLGGAPWGNSTDTTKFNWTPINAVDTFIVYAEQNLTGYSGTISISIDGGTPIAQDLSLNNVKSLNSFDDLHQHPRGAHG